MDGYCDRLSARIAVIAAITEKKSSAIIWKRVQFHMIAMIAEVFFFSLRS